jgi:hypothetical protein
MYKPWIGPDYKESQLLILGESAYSWPENDEWQHPSSNHSTETVDWTINNFPNCGQFLRTVSRGLANEENPTTDRLRFAWDGVAFTNYISGTVGNGARTRPTPEMWKAAERDFLSELSQLKPNPKRLIVLGKTMWSMMPATDIQITDDVQGYRLTDHVMMCFGLRHPAAGLSWRQLASAIHFEMAPAKEIPHGSIPRGLG